MSMPNPPEAAVSSAALSVVACAGMVVVDHLTPPIARLPRGRARRGRSACSQHRRRSRQHRRGPHQAGRRRLHLRRVGDDIFGRFATETLVAHGVDVKALGIDPRRATSQTLVVNVRSEDRRFIHSVGANLEFTSADIDQVLDPPTRVLHIGYFLILPELNAGGLAERFARARKSGTRTLLDVVTPGPGNYLEALRTVLPHTDVFVPNTDEATLILGEEDPVRQARIFHDLGARRVVITRGDRGLISVSDEQSLRVGAYPVDFVDGSGGGDAFNAGYIVGLLEDRSELDCLKLASAVGASCVRAVGTTAGVFDRSEAEEFLRRHELAVETLA